MDLNDLRRKRAEAIDSMNESLAEIHRVNAPPWLLSAMMAPVFLGLIVWEALAMVWVLIRIWVSLVGSMLVAPFAVVWLFVDICCMVGWYLSLVVQKMTGGKR